METTDGERAMHGGGADSEESHDDRGLCNDGRSAEQARRSGGEDDARRIVHGPAEPRTTDG
jgi:hypothetical protein